MINIINKRQKIKRVIFYDSVSVILYICRWAVDWKSYSLVIELEDFHRARLVCSACIKLSHPFHIPFMTEKEAYGMVIKIFKCSQNLASARFARKIQTSANFFVLAKFLKLLACSYSICSIVQNNVNPAQYFQLGCSVFEFRGCCLLTSQFHPRGIQHQVNLSQILWVEAWNVTAELH